MLGCVDGVKFLGIGTLDARACLNSKLTADIFYRLFPRSELKAVEAPACSDSNNAPTCTAGALLPFRHLSEREITSVWLWVDSIAELSLCRVSALAPMFPSIKLTAEVPAPAQLLPQTPSLRNVRKSKSLNFATTFE